MADDVDSLVREFRLLKCSALQPVANRNDPVYITHATVGQETQALATGETSGIVRISELENMTPQHVLVHDEGITGLEFSKANEKLLWTSSSCSEMSCWDLRASCSRAVQKLSSPNSLNYTCCGVGCDGDIIAGATEADGEDVCLYVWDVRSPNPFFTSIFTDSHKEDITQVKFHPRKSKSMASCSTDGLVCLFDVAHTEEEDALQFVLNSGSSVGRIGYYGDDFNKLFCITHIETLQLWDINQASLLADHSDIRKCDRGSQGVEYLIDCFYHPSLNKLYLITGKHSGDLQVFDITQDSISSVCTLTGGHAATVRCLEWYLKDEQIVTGGEDSTVCFWKATSQVLPKLDNTASTQPSECSAGNRKKNGKISTASGKARTHGTKPYSRPNLHSDQRSCSNISTKPDT